MARKPAADALLPAPVAGWPVVAQTGNGNWPADDVTAALARIRSERLWWPAPKSTSRVCQTADEVASDLAMIDPTGIKQITAPANTPLWRYGVMAGLSENSAEALLATSKWRCPWTGASLSLSEGVEALSFLHAAAQRNVGGFRLIGMSPWKRRCLSPFLTGADGPPGDRGRPVVWGGGKAPPDALRVEDGFLRSVGLGLRHTPPASLTFDDTAPYFDATRRNGFECVVDTAEFTPDLLDRARRLRTRVLELRLSKYNLASSAALPTPPDGKEAVLVPGQVETDASIRLGGVNIKTNLALLAEARRLNPDAFIIYKPHPDVLTGMREGGLDSASDFADHVELAATAPDCLDWADHVVTITSLMGFEALMRGKRVTTLGRPFYAGWGLTKDTTPPERSRSLSIDQLTAAALILYPRYIDSVSRLPAPVEIVVEALATELSAEGTASARLRRTWRNIASWALNRI